MTLNQLETLHKIRLLLQTFDSYFCWLFSFFIGLSISVPYNLSYSKYAWLKPHDNGETLVSRAEKEDRDGKQWKTLKTDGIEQSLISAWPADLSWLKVKLSLHENIVYDGQKRSLLNVII